MSETETLATETETDLDPRRAEIATWIHERRQKLAEQLAPQEAGEPAGARNQLLLERLDRLDPQELTESSLLIWEEYRSAQALEIGTDLEQTREAYAALGDVEGILREQQRTSTGADAEFAALLQEVVVKEAIATRNIIRHWGETEFRQAA